MITDIKCCLIKSPSLYKQISSLFSVDDGQKDNINTSAVALGVLAGVLTLVVFGLLLFIFRRNSRLQGNFAAISKTKDT